MKKRLISAAVGIILGITMMLSGCSLFKTYDVKYNLNGGSLRYASRDDMLEDFVKDYNEACGHNYIHAEDISDAKFENIDFHTFLDNTNDDGEFMDSKWGWMAEYLYDISKEKLPADNLEVKALEELVNGSRLSESDYKYCISYAFRAFILGTQLRTDSEALISVDFSDYDAANGFWDYLSGSEETFFEVKGMDKFHTAYKENYAFEGWYTNADFSGKAVKKAKGSLADEDGRITLYAKFTESTLNDVSITNAIEEIARFDNYRFEYELDPKDAQGIGVKFTSSDSTVLNVERDGSCEALKNGSCEVTVTAGKFSKSITVNVYTPDYFEIAYETESYTEIGKTIKLLAEYKKKDGTASALSWKSADISIATVDNDGVVTGVASGTTAIICTEAGGETVDFYVTVLPENMSDGLKLAVESNNSNVFARYNLGIGAGIPVYYRDIIGSVSKLQYNDELEIDETYEPEGTADTNHTDGLRSKYGFDLEFITVHYLGDMNIGTNAKAGAEYFKSTDLVSVHYTTGNDGVYHLMSDDLISWNAGDRISGLNGTTWIATGVKAPDTEDQTPTWSISENSKFTINGEETSVKVPVRGDGTFVTGPTFEYNGNTYPCINEMGLMWKVVDGEYYMTNTWWCYKQQTGGRICSSGGDYNSLSIESAVNADSDLWYTWHKTAQLVAKLMDENNLSIERVTGHHQWTAKNCPQPMLENNLEIWNEFIEMVEAEYEKRTTCKDYTYSMKLVEGGDVCTDKAKTYTYNIYGDDYTLTQNPGRVIPNEKAQVVVYEVTVTNGSCKEKIKLAAAVNSIYSEDESYPASTRYMGYLK